MARSRNRCILTDFLYIFNGLLDLLNCCRPITPLSTIEDEVPNIGKESSVYKYGDSTNFFEWVNVFSLLIWVIDDFYRVQESLIPKSGS